MTPRGATWALFTGGLARVSTTRPSRFPNRNCLYPRNKDIHKVQIWCPGSCQCRNTTAFPSCHPQSTRCDVPCPPRRCGPFRRRPALPRPDHATPFPARSEETLSRRRTRPCPTQTRASPRSPRPGRVSRVAPRRVPAAPGARPHQTHLCPRRRSRLQRAKATGTRTRATAAALEPGHVLPCMRVYSAAASRRMRTVDAAVAAAARSSEHSRRCAVPCPACPPGPRAPSAPRGTCALASRSSSRPSSRRRRPRRRRGFKLTTRSGRQHHLPPSHTPGRYANEPRVSSPLSVGPSSSVGTGAGIGGLLRNRPIAGPAILVACK